MHRGKCGDCSKDNICATLKGGKKGGKGKGRKGGRKGGKGRKNGGRKPRAMRQREVCDQDGNKYENKCKLAVARCEASNAGKTLKELPRPRSKFCL